MFSTSGMTARIISVSDICNWWSLNNLLLYTTLTLSIVAISASFVWCSQRQMPCAFCIIIWHMTYTDIWYHRAFACIGLHWHLAEERSAAWVTCSMYELVNWWGFSAWTTPDAWPSIRRSKRDTDSCWSPRCWSTQAAKCIYNYITTYYGYI